MDAPQWQTFLHSAVAGTGTPCAHLLKTIMSCYTLPWDTYYGVSQLIAYHLTNRPGPGTRATESTGPCPVPPGTHTRPGTLLWLCSLPCARHDTRHVRRAGSRAGQTQWRAMPRSNVPRQIVTADSVASDQVVLVVRHQSKWHDIKMLDHSVIISNMLIAALI